MRVDDKTGSVVIDENRCSGCGECAEACPFNAERTVIRLNSTTGKYVKCDLCGGNPQCVEICPTGALRYVEF